MKQLLKLPAAISIATVLTAGIPLALSQQAAALSSCPTDLLSGLTPYATSIGDNDAVNVGVKFNVRGAPFVNGVKFYKTSAATGTHIAHLYDTTSSTDLASAEFTSETGSGWQSVDFSSPVQVRDDHNYIVWVSLPNGNYAADSYYVGGSHDFTNGFGDSESVVYINSGNSGVYGYTSNDSTVPSNNFSANYWVSPVVGDSTAPQDNSSYSSSHSGTRVVSWTAGKDTNSATSTAGTARTSAVRTQGEIVSVLGYQAGGLSSFKDVTAFPNNSYSYTFTNKDYCGNGNSDINVSNAGSSQSYSNLFGSTAPGSTDSNTNPATVGMRWQTSTAGNVAGVRIYRASNVYPTGTTPLQVGLWNSSGTLLASQSLLPGNQMSGWINVFFDSPVSVSANTDYVAGYFSPNSQEEYTNSYFGSAVTSGTLTAPDSGSTPTGVYNNGSSMAFPSTASPNDSWYGVDVNFYIP